MSDPVGIRCGSKRMVYGPVGIDAIAGPTEILIVADGSVPARWTALDLCAQAEHDATAQAILISPYKPHIEAVRREIEALVPGLERSEIIERSFASRGAFITCRDLEEAVTLVNRFARNTYILPLTNRKNYCRWFSTRARYLWVGIAQRSLVTTWRDRVTCCPRTVLRATLPDLVFANFRSVVRLSGVLRKELTR
ncbi:MAG: hypothetical protein Ct9H300mP8_08170 [Gammaproteobacteria bacterium]|nr:MAG: hypothetical protein Ct9H300mP8_08170 [Gammaproteobacteria bacterium]